MPAFESRRVCTQPLTVTGASFGAWPARIPQTAAGRGHAGGANAAVSGVVESSTRYLQAHNLEVVGSNPAPATKAFVVDF